MKIALAESNSETVKSSNNGMTTKVVRGSLWSFAGQGITLFFSLFATPFVLRYLGAESYGVLTLINLFIGYLSFTDMGMGLASTKFGAAAYARGDDKEEVAVVWTSFCIALVPALIGASILSLCARPLVIHLLNLSTNIQRVVISSFYVASMGFIFRSVAGVFNTPQLSRLRLDLTTIITTVTGIAQICLVPVALFYGGDLLSAITIVAAMAITNCLLHVIVSWNLQPALAHPKFKIALVKPLMSFGSGVLISSLVGMALANGEKLIIPQFASVTALAHYSVAYTLAGLLTVATGAMSQSLLPAFSNLQTSSNHEALHQLYTRALRGSLISLTPVSLLICVWSKPFLILWAGADYGRESTLPLCILTIGVFFHALAYIPYNLLVASGKTGFIARLHSVELLPYLLISIILIRSFGAAGAAIAWSIRVVIDASVLFVSTKHTVKFPVFDFGISKYHYIVAIALFLPVFASVWFELSISSRMAISVVYIIVYSSFVWLQIFTSAERNWLARMLRKKYLS